MRNSEVWKRIFGWQVGDYLKYYFMPPGTSKGIWITLKILEISKGDFVKVKVLSKNLKEVDTFNLRIDFLQLNFPQYIRIYKPRESTVKKFAN